MDGLKPPASSAFRQSAFAVFAEGLDRDAQFDGGVAVGADELVVLEFDDVAVFTRDDARDA